jgi:WD40 repeat protein
LTEEAGELNVTGRADMNTLSLLLLICTGRVTAQEQATAKPLLILPGCPGQVCRVALSPDGTKVAYPGKKIPVPVFSMEAADKVIPLFGIPVMVKDLAPVQVRDAVTGKRLFKLMGHGQLISDLTFSPDGKRLASASWDETVRVWDSDTGHHLLTLRGHSGRVDCVAFSPDGNHLAAGSGFQVQLWDAKTGKLVRRVDSQGQDLFCLAYSPDGRQLAVGGQGGFIKVLDARTGEDVATLRENREAYVYGVAFSPDGKRIASASIPLGPLPRKDPIKVWDAATGERLLSVQAEPLQDTYSVAFSPDGRFIAGGGCIFKGDILQFAVLRFWDAKTGRTVITLRAHEGKIDDVAFSADGKRLVSASDDETVKVWEVAKLLAGR